MKEINSGASGYGMCANCGGTIAYVPGVKQCRYKAYACKD